MEQIKVYQVNFIIHEMGDYKEVTKYFNSESEAVEFFDSMDFDTQLENPFETTLFRDGREVYKEVTIEGDNKNKVYPGDFTKINSDNFGNPRYVCGFLTFIKDSDPKMDIEAKYKLALKRAKDLGGRKFHNKQYGGGIVFQSYEIQDTCNKINNLLNN